MEQMDRRRTVLVAGSARVADGSVLAQRGETLSLALEVDPSNDEIVAVDWTCITPLARDFVAGLLVGRSMYHADEVIGELQARVWLPSQRALIRAFLNAHNRYRDLKSNTGG